MNMGYLVRRFINDNGWHYQEVNGNCILHFSGPFEEPVTVYIFPDDGSKTLSFVAYQSIPSGLPMSSLYRLINRVNADSGPVRVSIIDDPESNSFGQIVLNIEWFANEPDFDYIFSNMLDKVMRVLDDIAEKF